jgi:hypothetical protein
MPWVLRGLFAGTAPPWDIWVVDFDEQIERLFRIIFGLSLPDVVDRSFCLK